MNLQPLLLWVGLAACLASPLAQAQGPAKGPHAALECSSCHAAGVASVPSDQDCLKCHASRTALAQRTEKLNPAFNPHASHREDESCTSCHAIHGKSRFICNDCHGFSGPGTQMK